MRQPFPEGLLKVGDVVRIEIDGIGELDNTVVEEPEGYLAPRERGGGGMGALTRRAARVPRRATRSASWRPSPRDGRPRQSLVYYVRDGDRLLISTLADRLKARDVRADRAGRRCA